MNLHSTQYYYGTVQAPYHLSVGAILRNANSEIACHHFEQIKHYTDLYILMRETVEPGETLEEALHRGLMEEFGATAAIVGYCGSIVANVAIGPAFQKTTLYFLCDLLTIDPGKRTVDDGEASSSIEWHTPDFLANAMRRQLQTYHEEDMDESALFERLTVFPAPGAGTAAT